MLRHIALPTTLILSLAAVTHAGDFHDDFSNPKLKERRSLRGDWKFENHVASCVADPELYKKFKNHGPILRWPAKFSNGTIEFELQAKGCQRLVITLNEKGHVFRMAFSDDKRTRIFGWIGQSSKENPAKTIAKEGVPTIKQLDGKWVKGQLVFQGDTALVKIGDYSAKLEHGSIGRPKGEFTISFASGKLAVRNVRFQLK